MSRTIRRKTTKPQYFNFESEAEFNFARDSYLSNAPRPEHIRPYLERPLVRALNPWGRYSWVEAPYESPEYKRHLRKSVEWWHEYRTSDAYIAHSASNDYKRHGYYKSTYKEHVAKETAMFHSDCGYRTTHHWTPREFRNSHFTRPWRRETKALIHTGMVYDEWDDLMFPNWKENAGWWYW